MCANTCVTGQQAHTYMHTYIHTCLCQWLETCVCVGGGGVGGGVYNTHTHTSMYVCIPNYNDLQGNMSNVRNATNTIIFCSKTTIVIICWESISTDPTISIIDVLKVILCAWNSTARHCTRREHSAIISDPVVTSQTLSLINKWMILTPQKRKQFLRNCRNHRTECIAEYGIQKFSEEK